MCEIIITVLQKSGMIISCYFLEYCNHYIYDTVYIATATERKHLH